MKRSILYLKRIQLPHTLLASLSFCALTSLIFYSHFASAQNFLEDQVDTLATIEVPATVVLREDRQILIPEPELYHLMPLLAPDHLIQSGFGVSLSQPQHRTDVVQDDIANRKGIRTGLKPAKAERPPYPRFAREQGWEGTVVLRIHVNRTGSVDTIHTRQTSGYPILDDSATQSVKTWTFEPAKDGEFPIPVTVDLPIRFDLDE